MAFFGTLGSLFSKKSILVVSVFEINPIFGLQLFFEKQLSKGTVGEAD